MKQCSKCREVKPLEAFHKAKGRPQDRHPQCKECRSQLGKVERLKQNTTRAEREELLKRGLLRCVTCEEVKSLDGFYRSSRSKSGRKGQCVECYKAVGAECRTREGVREMYRQRYLERRSANPEQFAEMDRNHMLRYKYGISIEEYGAMLEQQEGRCAICFAFPLPDKPLYVDHCHDSKKVRGLLCQKCNSGLGMFGDDENRLRSAIRYLMDNAVGHESWAATWEEPVT